MNKMPSHLAAVVKNQRPVMTETRVPINSAFLGANALETGKDRNLVSADFNDRNELMLTFDTGERIRTRAIDIDQQIEQHIDIAPPKIFDYIQFNQIANISPVTEGMISWNQEDGTLNIGMGGSNATQQVGLESYIRIYNAGASTILNGRPVYFAGPGSGNTLGGANMIADGAVNPLRFIGCATHDIPVGQSGYVTNFGGINGLNTTGSPFSETWNPGDVIYVSPFTAGALTKVRPITPQSVIAVGAVATVSATTGRLFISPRILPQIVYGSFNHQSDQTLSAGNTPTNLLASNTVDSSLITRVGNGFQVTTQALYRMNLYLNARKTGGSLERAWVWLRKNGVDVVDTTTTFTIQGSTTEIVLAADYAIKLLTTDVLEIMWAAETTNVYLSHDPAGAFYPASPSARIIMFQINP